MQLIVQFDTGGYEAWKTDFDAHTETRDAAGLTMLQMWRDTDDAGRAVVLFEVHDRARAEDWLHNQTALKSGVAAQFVKTA